jgi:hypothetical protein
MECSQKALQHHQHIHRALLHLVHHKCFLGVLPERVQGFPLLHPLPPLRKVSLVQDQHRDYRVGHCEETYFDEITGEITSSNACQSGSDR